MLQLRKFTEVHFAKQILGTRQVTQAKRTPKRSVNFVTQLSKLLSGRVCYPPISIVAQISNLLYSGNSIAGFIVSKKRVLLIPANNRMLSYATKTCALIFSLYKTFCVFILCVFILCVFCVLCVKINHPCVSCVFILPKSILPNIFQAHDRLHRQKGLRNAQFATCNIAFQAVVRAGLLPAH